ncbi:hypothetical protein Adt_05672 [Abeliophyllum distichum]|uniref:Uncharacterized protein n=1 Tax=Abeliophyllum distichum TaxID=126358 RepID=A0ABD1V4Q6_9LAMI
MGGGKNPRRGRGGPPRPAPLPSLAGIYGAIREGEETLVVELLEFMVPLGKGTPKLRTSFQFMFMKFQCWCISFEEIVVFRQVKISRGGRGTVGGMKIAERKLGCVCIQWDGMRVWDGLM